MKVLTVLSIFFLFLLAYSVHSMSPSQCAVYNSATGCNGNGCFWCDGCVNNKLGNNYGADKCVQSSFNCTYSCSTLCGAQCVTNADCHGNITDNTCYFNGVCSGCSCIYQQNYCPKPGTVKEDANGGAVTRECYYNTRSCGTNGCSVQSCSMGDSDICDPDKGCVYASSTNDHLEDYTCKGSELHAKLITYFCNATDCFYSKSDTLVERCSNGCNNGKCNEAYCNVYGIQTLCGQRNGFYGDKYCAGNDIYQSYRTYRCGTNECVFDEGARKIAGCSECQAGRCVDPGQVIYVNYTIQRPEQPTVNNSQNSTPLVITYPGGRLYNGLFFGSNEIRIPVSGAGDINFTIKQTNYLGALVVQADNLILMEGKLAPGTYTVPFNTTRGISIYTRSSGWIFFTPAIYDIRSIKIL